MINFAIKSLLFFLIASSPTYSAWFTSDGKFFEECMENRRSEIQNEIQLKVAEAYCRSKHHRPVPPVTSEKAVPSKVVEPVQTEPKRQTKKVDVQVEKKMIAEQKVRAERERVRTELASVLAKTRRNVKAESEKAVPSKVVEPVQSETKRQIEKAEADKAEADKAEADKAKTDKAEADKAKTDKAKTDKAEADKAEADKAKADKAKADKAKVEKAEAEKAKTDKAKVEKAEADKVAAEKAEAIGRKVAEYREVAEYKAKIIAKIRRNIVMLSNIPHNTRVEFDVTLLPGGMVLNAILVKPSGNAAYDSAVERAIKKAQPLPLPPDVTLFDKFRELRLTVTPIKE